MEISAKSVFYVNLATTCMHALSTVDKCGFFLKTPASLQFSDLHLDTV